MKSLTRNVWIRSAILASAAVCCSATVWAQGGDTSAQDKMFLMKSAQGSMGEIEMSKLALKKSKDADVKTFAQKMIDDHTMLIANMKPFADQMGVKPPTKLNATAQTEVRRLSSLSGDKFDHEFVTAMVGDHHKDLGEFMTERDSTSNADLKATVAKGTEVIMEHTQMIDGIAQKDGITVPPMPASTGTL